jgi:hypothetical protein
MLRRWAYMRMLVLSGARVLAGALAFTSPAPLQNSK